nr:MAG TPA: hypothetical protein [Caudoviricetes sp.]
MAPLRQIPHMAMEEARLRNRIRPRQPLQGPRRRDRIQALRSVSG